MRLIWYDGSLLPCDTSIEPYIIFLKDGIVNTTLGEIHYWFRILEPSLPSLQAAKMHGLDALAKMQKRFVKP